ncbi:MAG: murB [Alphaproteobacteria bacterium]|nr:murB [Alphaproteobacteria bacterium]
MSFADAEKTLSRLPQVKGRYTANESLAQSSWFGVGGPAEILFKPADENDLQQFLQHCPDDIPITILGVASNIIIRDGGIPGVVIKLGREFATMRAEGEALHIGAAALDFNTALFAQKNGIAGLEFLSGIPGTIGGALRMNAGCYGVEMRDILIDATALDRAGNKHVVSASDMNMQYRHTDAPGDWIFISCRLQGKAGDAAQIKTHMDEIKAKREASQPIREKTGGSTFANPERDIPGAGSAWQAVHNAGCRGLMVGGAQMSEKHSNFMINTGNATAADLENLGETVRETVKEKLGIELRWEIKRIGIKA